MPCCWSVTWRMAASLSTRASSLSKFQLMFPDSVIRALRTIRSVRPMMSSRRSTPISARYSRTSCARNVKKFTRYLAASAEAFAQFFVLRRHPYRAGVLRHLRIITQPSTIKGNGETEFFGSEHCHQYDVAACFELSVHLQHHLSAQAVQHQCLLRFAQTEFGRDAGITDG